MKRSLLHKNGRGDLVKTQVEKAVRTVCTRSQAGCEGGEQNLHREGELSNDHNIADGNREGGLSNYHKTPQELQMLSSVTLD